MEEAKTASVDTWICRIYLFLMLAGLPLAVHNGFFDIIETKTLFYVIPTIIYLLARLALTLYRFNGIPRRRGLMEDRAAIVFCLVCLLASLCGGDFSGSFLGVRGRWQGAGMMWLYAVLFLAFSRERPEKREILLPLCLGLALSGTLAVCNQLGWDPLGMCSRLSSRDAGRYISTLGNINFAGAYITLTLSVSAAALLTEERPISQWLLALVCVIGLWAAMAVRSESAVLGVGTALLLQPLLTKREPNTLRRWPLLLSGASVSAYAYRLIVYAPGKALSLLTEYITRPIVVLPLAAAGIVLFLMLNKREDKALFFTCRLYGYALLAALLLGIVVLILCNTVWAGVPLGEMDDWLHFSDSWGTDRGKVWAYCASLFANFPLWEKLIGGGCGVLASLDSQHRLFPDAVLDTAHCEYFQILLNWGVLGLGAYLAWLFFTVRRALRRGDALSFALCAGITGYSVQALVNIAQVPGIAIFFALLAAVHAQSDSEELTCEEKML